MYHPDQTAGGYFTMIHPISVGERNCTVLLDTWHLARSGGTVDDIGALEPGAIGAFQLSDRKAPPPQTAYVPMTGRLLPGEGELPLADILAAAFANSPGLTAEVEVFSEELAGLSVDAAAARTAAAIEAWRATFLCGESVTVWHHITGYSFGNHRSTTSIGKPSRSGALCNSDMSSFFSMSTEITRAQPLLQSPAAAS